MATEKRGRCLPGLVVYMTVCLLRGASGQDNEWSSWECSGDGSHANRTRSRLECDDNGNCTTVTETQTNDAPVTVLWSEWTEWSPSCNPTATFQQSRSRSCTLPPPAIPVCDSQCLQNKTVVQTRSSPPTACCEDLPWGAWSEWSDPCSDLVQTRGRNRTNCTTGETCPVCPQEIQNRSVSLQSWSSWGEWMCSEVGERYRQRVCDGGAGTSCQLCSPLGAIDSQNLTNENCSCVGSECITMETSTSHGSNDEWYIIVASIVAMLVAAVLCALLGAIFFYLCWRELKWRQSYRVSQLPTTSSSPTSPEDHTHHKEDHTHHEDDHTHHEEDHAHHEDDHARHEEDHTTERRSQRRRVSESDSLQDVYIVHSSRENLIEGPAENWRVATSYPEARNKSARSVSREELLFNEDRGESDWSNDPTHTCHTNNSDCEGISWI